MRLKDFDYFLPKQLIAQQPLERRDSSRLMVLDRTKHSIEHVFFYDLPRYLCSGDVLVANDTRVVPARLFGNKQSGGWVELFLLQCLENRTDDVQIWECLLKSRRKTRAPARIMLPQGLLADVLERMADDGRIYFSTNFRRFKFTEEMLNARSIHEISRQTVPPDFRNRRIHRCWLIEK